MSLTAEQYQSIIRLYDKRRLDAIHTQQLHLEEIRSQIPAYSELEDEAAAIALSYARLALDKPDIPLDEMDARLSEISAAKQELLREHGISPSYAEPPYFCAECGDTGYIGTRKCRCFKQEEIQLLYNQSNIRKQLETENFSNLRYDLFEGEDAERFGKAVSVCKGFIENFDKNPQNLMLFGTVGTGKSFLSGCIAHELIESGHSVIYFSASDLFATMSANTFRKSNEPRGEIANRELFDCDLLVIDDLGTELNSQFVNSSLFTCLNERQLRHKPLIISTNLSLAEIHERYSDRVFSRIVGNFDILKLTGPDLRVKYKRTQPV